MNGRWRLAVGLGSRSGVAPGERGQFWGLGPAGGAIGGDEGGSRAHSIRAELGVPVAAGGWLRRANFRQPRGDLDCSK
jgi:hypothetical protein